MMSLVILLGATPYVLGGRFSCLQRCTGTRNGLEDNAYHRPAEEGKFVDWIRFPATTLAG